MPPGARRPLFVSFQPPDHVRAILQNRREVRFPDPGAAGAAGLARQIGDAEAAMVVVTDDLSADVIAGLPASLRAIATYSVGYDHIDLEAAAARGVAVLNTPDVLSAAVAENALFLMLAVARRATESVALIRSGRWSGWTPSQLLGFELRGKTLGILGMGRIGQEVAARAAPLGMAVAYHDVRPVAAPEGAQWRYEPDILRFLAGLDVLLLAAPSTPSTRQILNARAIEALQPSSCVVNVARGDLVDDDALIAALRAGRLRGAALDVFNGEPHFDKRYAELPNAFLTPHIGSSTLEARAAMAEILLDGLDAVANGVRPANRLV